MEQHAKKIAENGQNDSPFSRIESTTHFGVFGRSILGRAIAAIAAITAITAITAIDEDPKHNLEKEKNMLKKRTTNRHKDAYGVVLALAGFLVFSLPASGWGPMLGDCATVCTCSVSCSQSCTPDGGFTTTTCGAEGLLCNGNLDDCRDPCLDATPPNSCPATACPFDLSGWSNVWGTCTEEDEHGCVEECPMWCNQTTFQFCLDTNNCAVQ